MAAMVVVSFSLHTQYEVSSSSYYFSPQNFRGRFQKNCQTDCYETYHEAWKPNCADPKGMYKVFSNDLDLQRVKVTKTVLCYISKTAGQNVTKFIHMVDYTLGHNIMQ